MRNLLIFLSALVCLGVVSGCGKVSGPRFWWDDRNQTRLDDYSLPADPAASPEADLERAVRSDGRDITDDNLRDYRTNLDQEEERRKSDASLLNF